MIWKHGKHMRDFLGLDFLRIIPWARVGYEMIANKARSAELAIIISYPTSASGIIVLLKTPPKYRKLDYNKNKKAQKSRICLPCL